MPKRSKFPGLRSHSWRTAGGEICTAYYLDRRATGERDLPLGTDYAAALAKWHEITQDRPLHAGTLREAFDAWERDALPHYRQTTRRDYALSLAQLRPVFEAARWDDVTLPVLKGYLRRRTAKTRANRELAVLSIIWRWAQTEGLTTAQWPAAGLERSRWKNPEKARQVEVTPAIFAAVYAEADQVLRDAMDIASATGLRLTDVVTVGMPADGVLRGQASKTGKRFALDATSSPVLSAMLERRRAYRVAHTMLLSTPTRSVTLRMLSDRWTLARDRAAAKVENRAIAADLRRVILRDMRKMAADLAPTLDDAADLLQHDDKRLTQKHYRLTVTTRKAVR